MFTDGANAEPSHQAELDLAAAADVELPPEGEALQDGSSASTSPSPSPLPPPPRLSEAEELERLRKLVVPPEALLDMTLKLTDDNHAHERMGVAITLRSTLAEDCFNESGLSVQIFREGERKATGRKPLRYAGPRPGPHDPTDIAAKPFPPAGVVEQIGLPTGEAGSYVLEVEYLTEIGVRAFRRTTFRVLPRRRELPPAMRRSMEEVIR